MLLDRVQAAVGHESFDGGHARPGYVLDALLTGTHRQSSTRTVQDPHAPSPQPGLAPVRPNSPRSADSSDMVAGTECSVP